MSFTSPVARIRTERGWTQAGLAARSGVPRSSISAIEIGRLVPSVDTALTLARTLGASVEALFDSSRSADTPQPELAWKRRTPAPQWVWRARVGARAWWYPVEGTAAGVLPPDGMVGDAGFDALADPAIGERTLVMAGCDPSVALLASAISEMRPVRVLPLPRSSREALDLLRTGRVHVAGIHLTDARGHAINSAAVREHLGAGYTLLHLMRWEEGVATRPTPRSRSIETLLRNGRWVNREVGSAARLCFDHLLGRRRKPQGYHRTVRSHRAVAATVSSGWADAGICIRAVADEAGLGFLPVQEADYELCIPDSLFGEPVVTALVEAIRSPRYRRWIGALAGCDAGRTGALNTVGAP